jgi:hypothetical protein
MSLSVAHLLSASPPATPAVSKQGYSCTKLLRSRGAFPVVDAATARATVSPVTPPSARQLLAITAAMLRRRVIRSGHRSGRPA